MDSLPLNRVICGDALSILKQFPANSVDLIVTDPPYGDNVGYGPSNLRIAGNEHPLVALQVMTAAYRVLKKNTAAYLFCGMRHLWLLRLYFTHYTRYRIREVVIWDKVAMNVGPAFRKQYECILVLEKGRPRYRNRRMLNLISLPRLRSPDHPHAKPVDLIKKLILHSSDPGDIVLDPFLGTGTTALAARELGRKYIGIELDPDYAQLAQSRLSQPLLLSESHLPLTNPRNASPPRLLP